MGSGGSSPCVGHSACGDGGGGFAVDITGDGAGETTCECFAVVRFYLVGGGDGECGLVDGERAVGRGEGVVTGREG